MIGYMIFLCLTLSDTASIEVIYFICSDLFYLNTDLNNFEIFTDSHPYWKYFWFNLHWTNLRESDLYNSQKNWSYMSSEFCHCQNTKCILTMTVEPSHWIKCASWLTLIQCNKQNVSQPPSNTWPQRLIHWPLAELLADQGGMTFLLW